MASDFRQFDEHGLPRPQKFVDMRSVDDELPRKPTISPRKKRLVLLILVLGVIVPIIFGPQLINVGRQTLGSWLQSRADRKLMEGDKRGALEDLNQAIGWNPNAWSLYSQRSVVRLQLNELEGSREDLTKAIDLLENVGKGRVRGISRKLILSNCYAQRSWISVRLNRGRDAVDDATKAVELEPMNPVTLNTRAYARALSNLELSDGLADIDKALLLLTQNDLSRAFGGGVNLRENSKADFLDTRGFLLHLLDRNEEALKELNRAIAMTDAAVRNAEAENKFLSRREPVQGRNEEEYAHALAVMHQHRGLVRQKLGQESEAESDLQRAKELGYDPENGVF